MAARKEDKILRIFSAKLTKAIDIATGSVPAMFSAQLVANDFISEQGAKNIIQVAANPPYAMISQLVMTVLEQVKAASDKEAQRLFELFLIILRELEVRDLPDEMDKSYRGDDNPIKISSDDVKCVICKCVWYKPVTIKCGHTFCRKCVLQQMKQSDLTPLEFKCAVCRKIIDAQPMFFNQSTARCLDAYFQQNPREEAKLKEANRGQEISKEEFRCQYEKLTAKANEKPEPSSYFS